MMKSLFKIFNYFLIGLLGVCPTLSRTSSSHTLCALLGDDSLNYSEVDKKRAKEIENLFNEILKMKNKNSNIGKFNFLIFGDKLILTSINSSVFIDFNREYF